MANEVSEGQLSLDASQEMMREKLLKPEERFEKEKKENIKNLILIETETVNIKKKLQDLEDRSWRGNLLFG